MPAQNDILEEINTTLPNLDSIVSQMSKESVSGEPIDKQSVEQISPLEVHYEQSEQVSVSKEA